MLDAPHFVNPSASIKHRTGPSGKACFFTQWIAPREETLSRILLLTICEYKKLERQLSCCTVALKSKAHRTTFLKPGRRRLVAAHFKSGVKLWQRRTERRQPVMDATFSRLIRGSLPRPSLPECRCFPAVCRLRRKSKILPMRPAQRKPFSETDDDEKIVNFPI